ncbi:MAG: hypothetical protein ACI9EF_001999 [Pseudohongiellaceae bacterium]|jgi:hypothetical protein
MDACSMRVSLLSCVALLLCGLAGRASAQGTPLPPSLVSDWSPLGSNYSGIRFLPSTDPADRYRVSAVVQFDTEKQLVSFLWDIMPAGGRGLTERVDHEVLYKPTDICTQNGYGPVLYVAGFIEESAQVIVEEWTFREVVGERPQEGTAVSSLPMTLQKRTVLLTDSVGPLFGMAYNSCSERLWLFEGVAPGTVYSLGNDGLLQYQFDAASCPWPSMATAGRITAAKIEPTAPDGGGFVMFALPGRSWERLPRTTDYDIVILRDSDCDGVLDECVNGTCQSLIFDRDYLDHDQYMYQ